MAKPSMKETVYHLNKEENRAEKSGYVRQMFNEIAGSYDFMNHLMSGGVDIYWRKFSIKKAQMPQNAKVLDVCTGTCDLALTAAKLLGPEAEVFGVDLTEGMLRVGQKKMARSGYQPTMGLSQGRAESLPFKDNYFDVAMASCGIRNTTDIPKSFSEMARVVKPGGLVFNLDLGHPKNKIFDQLYRFYFFKVVPIVGRVLAHNEAYAYLPTSLLTFPDQEKIKRILEDVGLKRVHYYNLFGGAMALHIGYKE